MTLHILLSIFSIFVYFLIYNYRKKISLFFDVNDIPNQTRKIHKQPIPKTASYSIFVTLVVIFILDFFFKIYDKDFNFVIIGTLLTFVVGYLDDKFNLSATIKIILCALISLILINFGNDLMITKFYIYSFDTFFNLEKFSIIFTILCVLCLINSLNLADGINGLATGLIFFWLLYIIEIYKDYLSAENISLIFIILINLILIFIYNLRNKHFLGDAGSLMLSSFVAFLIIYLHNQKIDDPNHRDSAESIFLLLIIPVLDLIRLLFTRLIKKLNPAKGDKNHLHHHFINNFTLGRSLLYYFLLSNIPIMLAIFTFINKFFIIIITILIYIVTIISLKKNEKIN